MYLFLLANLEKAIDQDFCSFDEFKKQLATASIAIQGSGWGWLGFNPQTKKLTVTSCANQDPLFSTTGIRFKYFHFFFICIYCNIFCVQD